MPNLNNRFIVDITPTIDTAIYAAGDVIGGLQTITVSDGQTVIGGQLRRLIIVDDDAEEAVMDIWLFNAQPSAIADQAPFAPTVADLQKLIGTIPVVAGDYATAGSESVGEVAGLAIDFTTTDGNLYAYAVVGGTPTFTAATDLTLRFIGEYGLTA